MASKRKTTLDQIEELLKPAPEIGSDDDLDFDTKAKVTEDFEEEFIENDKPRRPTLKQSAALDDDPRYIGKRISRRDAGIAEDSGNESSEASGTEPQPEEGSSDSERNFKSSGVEADSDDDEGENEEYESEEEEDSEDYESEDNEDFSILKSEDDKETYNDTKKEKSDNFQHISSVKNLESEIEKGKAVKCQLNIWDSLLECRINLQKCLIPSNRLPKYNKIDSFKEEGGEEFASEMKKTQRSVKKLLDKLVDLQETLVNNFSETKNLGKRPKKERSHSDEEIPSDSEQECNNEDLEIEVKPPKKKRRHCEDYEEVLSTGHKQYMEFRDATIQKWNDRTRMITGKASSRDFSAFEQSTLQQIRHILGNRTRLLQRTRIPRSVGPILGDPEPAEDLLQPEHDTEIFDDSDFYHQLLRELIDRRTNESQDSAALGRRWAALQKLRNKMKRRVDTRATKGRRLRYDPHKKLVGYMAPVISPSVWSEKAISELYNSLFGKKV